MRTQFLERLVIKSLPAHVPVIFWVRRRRKMKKKMENFETEFQTRHWRYCRVTLSRCAVLVGFVKVDQMPKSTHSRSMEAFSHVRISAHIRVIYRRSKYAYYRACLPLMRMRMFRCSKFWRSWTTVSVERIWSVSVCLCVCMTIHFTW